MSNEHNGDQHPKMSYTLSRRDFLKLAAGAGLGAAALYTKLSGLDVWGFITKLADIPMGDKRSVEASGAKIVFDVKCSRVLPEIIKKYGGKPIMSRTGHSLLKARMIAEDAPLAGEMSGHIFFKDGWYGFDDGIYVAARLV